MKKLRKSICLLLVVSMLFGANGVPFYAAETGNEVSSEENTEETSGFDENSHGEVLEEGECGENVDYKLYEDKTLYIYGKRVMKSPLSDEERKNVFDVYIDNGIRGAEKLALSGYAQLRNVKISDSMDSISYAMFENCIWLTEIQLPENIARIEDSAFYECKSLKKIIVPKNVKSIGYGTFYGCSSLNEIVFPDGMTSIGMLSFGECKSLKEINIPDTVESIGANAFYGCKNMTEIIIPDSVKEIGVGAFDNRNIKICCNHGTVAEKYAKENKIKFKLLDIEGQPEIQIRNTFNGCKRSPVKLSITCKESERFTFVFG